MSKEDVPLYSKAKVARNITHFTRKSQNLINRTIWPVMKCLTDHHKDSEEDFLKTHTKGRDGNFAYGRFSDVCKKTCETADGGTSGSSTE